MTMEKRHFHSDPLTGAVETFYYDHATDEFHIERVENLEPLIEVAKAKYNDAPGTWKGFMHHVASIPPSMVVHLQKQGILSGGGRVLDMPRFKAWLNDRDNRVFRTRPGRV